MAVFKVPLKKICGDFRRKAWITEKTSLQIMLCSTRTKKLEENDQKGLVSAYDFDLLKKDLLDTTIPNAPIEVMITINSNEKPEYRCERNKYTKYFDEYDYIVIEGNHRCYILNETYGDNYIIDCILADENSPIKN